MRRYGVLGVLAIVLLLAALRSGPSGTVSAAPVVSTPSLTPTVTATATATATSTATSTPIIIRTATATSTKTQTPTQTRTATPTNTVIVKSFFPFVARQPTYTPSATNTPTPTDAPSATNTPLPTFTPSPTLPPTPSQPPYNVTTGHLSGQISWKDHPDIPQYYMNIEWIKYLAWLHNDSGNSIEPYEILGVQVYWPDGVRNAFHTSWTGAPDYVAANCYGPNGPTLDWNLPLRCAGDAGSGQTEDHIGASSNIPVDTAGQYTVKFFACQSGSVSACTNGGEWHQLGADLTMVAVPPPSEIHSVPPPPTGPFCQLAMTDATHGNLQCAPYKPSKSRPGGPH